MPLLEAVFDNIIKPETEITLALKALIQSEDLAGLERNIKLLSADSLDCSALLFAALENFAAPEKHAVSVVFFEWFLGPDNPFEKKFIECLDSHNYQKKFVHFVQPRFPFFTGIYIPSIVETACCQGNVALVKLLFMVAFQYNQNISLKNVLKASVGFRHSDLRDYLLSFENPFRDQIFSILQEKNYPDAVVVAAMVNDYEIIGKLFQAGATYDYPFSDYISSCLHPTPLLVTVLYNCQETFEYLLGSENPFQEKIIQEIKNAGVADAMSYENPLSGALVYKNYKIAMRLLDEGVDFSFTSFLKMGKYGAAVFLMIYAPFRLDDENKKYLRKFLEKPDQRRELLESIQLLLDSSLLSGEEETKRCLRFFEAAGFCPDGTFNREASLYACFTRKMMPRGVKRFFPQAEDPLIVLYQKVQLHHQYPKEVEEAKYDDSALFLAPQGSSPN